MADSVTPSNIAILILPALITSLVPISFFQSIDCARKSLIYPLVTDVISVLPLIFKGIELLSSARMQHTGCVERVSDSRLNDSITRIEISCASCTHHSWFTEYGIAILVIAIVLLVIGIFIELVSYKYMIRRLIAKNGKKVQWKGQWQQ